MLPLLVWCVCCPTVLRQTAWVLPGFSSATHQDPQAAACDPADNGVLHVPVCALLCGSTHGTRTALGLPGPRTHHAHLLRVSVTSLGACAHVWQAG